MRHGSLLGRGGGPAARRHRDAGTISRYLNGKRVPPWDFVVDLMSDAAQGHGGPTEEALEHIRELHRTALRAGGSPQHTIQLLQDELADNDRRTRQWDAYRETLLQALQDRQHRIEDLELQMRELEAGHGRDLAEAAGAIARYQDDAESLRTQRDQLKAEIADLKEELARAKEHSLFHEQRCRDLERQLEEAEPDNPENAGGTVESKTAGDEIRDEQTGPRRPARAQRHPNGATFDLRSLSAPREVQELHRIKDEGNLSLDAFSYATGYSAGMWEQVLKGCSFPSREAVLRLSERHQKTVFALLELWDRADRALDASLRRW
ncbi:hypothetical protein [Streptomyces sp. NPDC046759]|uniref:hypothetical protein n=1 Tax=Streptomyces sp. NPDC046759 TaxID=3155019 RepID=UPI0033ED4991